MHASFASTVAILPARRFPSAVPTCSSKSLRECSLRVRVGCLDRRLAQIVGTALVRLGYADRRRFHVRNLPQDITLSVNRFEVRIALAAVIIDAVSLVVIGAFGEQLDGFFVV